MKLDDSLRQDISALAPKQSRELRDKRVRAIYGYVGGNASRIAREYHTEFYPERISTFTIKNTLYSLGLELTESRGGARNTQGMQKKKRSNGNSKESKQRGYLEPTVRMGGKE